MIDRQPSRVSSTFALGFGGLAVLLPLLYVTPRSAVMATGASLLIVGALVLRGVGGRAGPLSFVALAPVTGAVFLAAGVAHVNPGIVTGTADVQWIPVLTGIVAGVAGTTVLAVLIASAIGQLSQGRFWRAFVSTFRVVLTLLVLTGISAAWGSVDVSAWNVQSVGVAALEAAPQEFLAIIVFALGAVLVPYASSVYRQVRSLPRLPIPDLTIPLSVVSPDTERRTPDEQSEESDRGNRSGERDEKRTDTAPERDVGPLVRHVVLYGLVALAFVRPVVMVMLGESSHPYAITLSALNDELVSVVGSVQFVWLLGLALLSLVSVPFLSGVVRWVRRRHDRRGRVFGTHSASLLLLSAFTVLVHLIAPSIEPMVVNELVGAGVSQSIVGQVMGSLPLFVLGGTTALAVLGAVPFLFVLLYRAVSTNEGDSWLVYRNFVLLLTVAVVVAAAVHGVPPLVVFVAVVSVLLSWELLEYGRTLSIEMGARSLQPPEVAHAITSVGVGVLLVGLTFGVYVGGRSFTPSTELSYLAAPVILLSSALLLYFLNG